MRFSDGSRSVAHLHVLDNQLSKYKFWAEWTDHDTTSLPMGNSMRVAFWHIEGPLFAQALGGTPSTDPL